MDGGTIRLRAHPLLLPRGLVTTREGPKGGSGSAAAAVGSPTGQP